MREVFPREESVDCLSCLISAEFKGWRGRGEEDREPRALKATCMELGASEECRWPGEELACPELAAVRLGSKAVRIFSVLCSSQVPGSEEEQRLPGSQKHRFVPPLGYRSPAACPPGWTAAGPPGLPALCAAPWPSATGAVGEEGPRAPFACARLCCCHGLVWSPCFRCLKGK